MEDNKNTKNNVTEKDIPAIKNKIIESYKLPDNAKIEKLVDSGEKVKSVNTAKSVNNKDIVKKWLDSVSDKKLERPSGIGIIFDGTVDDKELVIMKENAKRTIQKNIQILYKTKIKKVAIIGTAMSYKKAPYGDPDWEIWGLNDHWNMVPRATRWFEANYGACQTATVSHDKSMKRIDWLRKTPIPVYMEEHYPDIPMSIKYPFDEINDWISTLDTCGSNYFTNSISFMIALAAYEGFDLISLYGVDMAVGSEFEEQRPSCEFWAGVCKGLGIKLHIPEESDLLKCLGVYGRCPKKDPFVAKMRDRRIFQESQLVTIANEVKKRKEEIQRLTETQLQYQGSLSDIKQTMKVWGEL